MQKCVFTVFFVALIKVSCCACPPANLSQAYQYNVIPEKDYDRNYSAISSERKQPLGFDKAVWMYNQPDMNPCVHINLSSKPWRLEIMFETHPQARLCVKNQDQTSAPVCSDPGTGNAYDCRMATSEDAYLEFFCDSQCGESDIQFWYRLVPGVSQSEDREDQWCGTRDQSQYPKSLLQLPLHFSMNQETTTPGISSRNSASLRVVLSLVSVYIANCIL